MPQPVRLSLVIPVYNNWSCTRDCLASVARHVRDGREDWFEVLVVDDASADETPAELPALGAALFGERFRLLTQPRNLGFAAAVNRGAQAARGDWLFLLNNDTVLAEDCLSPCVAALEADASLLGVGPTLVYPSGKGEERLQHLGVAVAHSIKCVHAYHLYPAGHDVARQSRRLQCITAAAMCLERRRFLELDGFFEGYVNGMEDVDFCARALQHAGGHGYFSVLPGTRLIHAEHQSPGRFARELENARLLSQRCGGLLRPDVHRLAMADGYALAFTPWLDPVLTLGPERRRRMADLWKADPRPQRVEQLLALEPAWEKGYAVLAGWLEHAGDLAAALAMRVRQGAFLPSLAVLEEIQRLARACGQGERLQTARAQLAAVRQAMADSPALQQLATTERDAAAARGDTTLQEIWDQWMRSITS